MLTAMWDAGLDLGIEDNSGKTGEFKSSLWFSEQCCTNVKFLILINILSFCKLLTLGDWYMGTLCIILQLFYKYKIISK